MRLEQALDALESEFPDDRTVRAWTAEERARIALAAGRLGDADRLYRTALAVAGVRGDPAEIVERAVDRAWALIWWSADTATGVGRLVHRIHEGWVKGDIARDMAAAEEVIKGMSICPMASRSASQ